MLAAEQRADGRILPYGHRAERPHDLEGAADAKPGDPVRRHPGDRRTLPPDVAAVEAVDAADAVEERRLAGAVGAGDADDPPPGDLEGHAVDGGDASETLGDTKQLQL